MLINLLLIYSSLTNEKTKPVGISAILFGFTKRQIAKIIGHNKYMKKSVIINMCPETKIFFFIRVQYVLT